MGCSHFECYKVTIVRRWTAREEILKTLLQCREHVLSFAFLINLFFFFSFWTKTVELFNLARTLPCFYFYLLIQSDQPATGLQFFIYLFMYLFIYLKWSEPLVGPRKLHCNPAGLIMRLYDPSAHHQAVHWWQVCGVQHDRVDRHSQPSEYRQRTSCPPTFWEALVRCYMWEFSLHRGTWSVCRSHSETLVLC